MSKFVEITENISRTYRIEVDDETSDILLKNNDAYSWYNDIALEDYLHYHEKGTLIDEDNEIEYASLIANENMPNEEVTELYYSF